MFILFSLLIFFFSLYGDHRDLHVLTHSFPTRRSSDLHHRRADEIGIGGGQHAGQAADHAGDDEGGQPVTEHRVRSEEHTSELQSLMRISYAGLCLKNKNDTDRRDKIRLLLHYRHYHANTMSY